MDNQPPVPGQPTLASIQAKIDAPQFEKSSVHIIERFLEHFASDGTMTFDVPKHILEALAARFRPFLDHEVATLDKAFGGQTGRQRQAIDTATQVDTITFMVIEELKRLHAMPPSDRDPGTPYSVACENVAEQQGMSADNVQRLYKLSQPKP